MCATCGCMKPKDKHGMKTLAAANKKFDKKGKGKACTCGTCKDCKAKKSKSKGK